jgi:hypothetical protein
MHPYLGPYELGECVAIRVPALAGGCRPRDGEGRAGCCRCRCRRDLGANDLNNMAVKGDGRRICAGKGDGNEYLGAREAGFRRGNQDLAGVTTILVRFGTTTRSSNVARPPGLR